MSNYLDQQDWDIRLAVYRYWIEQEGAPSYQDIAQRLELSPENVRTAFHRLNAGHALFLRPDTDKILMAHPLSSIETDYQVKIEAKTYYANCAWDSLGIPAMIGKDADIKVRHPLTGQTIQYAIVDGNLAAQAAVVHFALPFSQWYDDLVDT